ncbi:hypothetical protein ACQP2X_27780 [Actinoplanes sp. CA-131856]
MTEAPTADELARAATARYGAGLFAGAGDHVESADPVFYDHITLIDGGGAAPILPELRFEAPVGFARPASSHEAAGAETAADFVPATAPLGAAAVVVRAHAASVAAVPAAERSRRGFPMAAGPGADLDGAGGVRAAEIAWPESVVVDGNARHHRMFSYSRERAFLLGGAWGAGLFVAVFFGNDAAKPVVPRR